MSSKKEVKIKLPTKKDIDKIVAGRSSKRKQKSIPEFYGMTNARSVEILDTVRKYWKLGWKITTILQKIVSKYPKENKLLLGYFVGRVVIEITPEATDKMLDQIFSKMGVKK